MEMEMIIKRNITKLEEERNIIIEKYSTIVWTFSGYDVYVNTEEKNKMKNIMNNLFDDVCLINEKLKLLNELKTQKYCEDDIAITKAMYDKMNG